MYLRIDLYSSLTKSAFLGAVPSMLSGSGWVVNTWNLPWKMAGRCRESTARNHQIYSRLGNHLFGTSWIRKTNSQRLWFGLLRLKKRLVNEQNSRCFVTGRKIMATCDGNEFVLLPLILTWSMCLITGNMLKFLGYQLCFVGFYHRCHSFVYPLEKT